MKTSKQKSPKKPNVTGNKVLVNVILDRSGSMSANRIGTIDGYNEYLNGLRSDKATEYDVTLIQFDAVHGPELTVSYTDKPLADVPPLAKETYEPRGNTPLYDAIGECIRRVAAKARAVLTVIITDGMENASREFTQDSIKSLIKQKEAEGWKFAFLGANIDSIAVGGSIGVAAHSAANYAPGQEKALYANLARSTSLHASNVRTHGASAALSMAFVDDSQRHELMGGRPAAPPTFPQFPESKRTQWNVRS